MTYRSLLALALGFVVALLVAYAELHYTSIPLSHVVSALDGAQ